MEVWLEWFLSVLALIDIIPGLRVLLQVFYNSAFLV